MLVVGFSDFTIKFLAEGFEELNVVGEEHQHRLSSQTYSHVGLINAAFRISKKLDMPTFNQEAYARQVYKKNISENELKTKLFWGFLAQTPYMKYIQ